MPWVPQKFADWPQTAVAIQDPRKVQELYESGFAGVWDNRESKEELLASLEFPDGEQVAHDFGLADSGAGKLVIPFIHVLSAYPGGLPGAAQQRGDCVSHGCKNALLTTMCCDVASGTPDAETGNLEEYPEVPAEGIQQGILSSEAIYWHRGYNGDGWYCSAAVKVATTKAGLFVRKPYPDLGIDLTRYSSANAGKYGSRSPTTEIVTYGQKYLAHTATAVSSFESRRDFLNNGYGVIDCGSEGYSSTRDANGVSVRSGSWAHSMCEIGVDDRDVIKQIYGEPLVLILNSWGKWNTGPRDIHQSAALVPAHLKTDWIAKGLVNPTTGNIMIPEGAFWAKWSHVSRRECFAFSGVKGFPARTFVWDI